MSAPISWPLIPDPPPASPPPELAGQGFTAEAYARQLKQLLPPGRLWNVEPESELSKTLLGIATELARIDARGVDLINESDPRTATETLADWERILSLPDDRVLAIPGTTAGRRTAITQKFTAREGQNVAFFVRLALACGYTLQPVAALPPPVANVNWFSGVGGTLPEGAVYSYRVTALNDVGETVGSAEVSVAIPVVPITGTNTNRVQVNWAAVVGATGYRVYGRTLGVERLIATLGAVLTYMDTGAVTPAGDRPRTEAISVPVLINVTPEDDLGGALLGDTEYFYRVAAVDAAGETFASAEVSGSTDPGTNTNQLRLTWSLVGGTSYKIFGRTAGYEKLIATVGVTSSYVDDGTVVPAGDPVGPSATTEPITKFVKRLLRVGFRVGDRCWGSEWAYAMRLNVLSIDAAALSQADFERVIRHVTHSHITDVFLYP